MLSEARTALVRFVRSSSHKLGASSQYIVDLPYTKGCQTQDALEWAALHDDRVILRFSELPDSFRKAVVDATPQAFADVGGPVTQEIIDNFCLIWNLQTSALRCVMRARGVWCRLRRFQATDFTGTVVDTLGRASFAMRTGIGTIGRA